MDHRQRANRMDDHGVLAVSGTPGVGKTSLSAVLDTAGRCLAGGGGRFSCLDDIDEDEAAH